MRVPTSVVVMSILTGVPFGLAVRDTVRGPTAVIDTPDSEPRPSEEELEQQAHDRDLLVRLQAREAESREARRDAQRTILRHLYIHDDEFLWDYRVDEPAITVHYTIDGVHVELTDELLCDELASELASEWGPASFADGDSSVWLDPPGFPGRERVALAGCKLDYDHYLPAGAMVTRDPDSTVPVSAIGVDGRLLEVRLTDGHSPTHVVGVPADRARGVDFADGDYLSWSVPGIGAGSGRTQLKALARHGKIMQVFATGTAPDATLDELEAAITATFGQPTPDPHDDRARRWAPAGSPPIALLRSQAGYTIVVGMAR